MIRDEIEDKIRQVLTNGEKPRIICMNQKQMKQLQHELETTEEILRYKDMEISILPYRDVKEIYIITERSYRLLIDIFATTIDHLQECDKQ